MKTDEPDQKKEIFLSLHGSLDKTNLLPVLVTESVDVVNVFMKDNFPPVSKYLLDAGHLAHLLPPSPGSSRCR